MRPARAMLTTAAAVLGAAIAGCGSADRADRTSGGERVDVDDRGAIRIGTKNFTEQVILGELYRQALEAKGYRIVLKSSIGSSELIHSALRRKALDMYPEYVGVLLSEVAELVHRPRSDTVAYERAKAFERRHGFTLLAQTPLSNPNALGVKPEFAKRHRLRSIADLRRLGSKVTIGALPEFRGRYEGLEGLRAVYKLDAVRFHTLPPGARYQALERGTVDVLSVFGTDGQLAGGKYVLLEDPKHLFASGHVAPIIDDAVLAAHGPGLRRAIDAVSRVLTTSAMRRMNAAVDLHGERHDAVARAFLLERGLVSAAASPTPDTTRSTG